MVVQPVEVSRDTGCLSWLVLTRGKAGSLQNAVCSPDKNLSCSSLSGKSTQEDRAQPLKRFTGSRDKKSPQNGGLWGTVCFWSPFLLSLKHCWLWCHLQPVTIASGPGPTRSRALRTPLAASPKMGRPVPALWSTGVTQRQKGAGVPAQVSAGTAELFNPGPEESDSCLISPRFLLVSTCWLLFSCAPQACDYPDPRAWLPSGPINQSYQHHSPPCRTCPSLPATPQLSHPRRHREFAGEVGQGAGEGDQDPQPVSVGWGSAAEGLCSRGAAAAAQTHTHR